MSQQLDLLDEDDDVQSKQQKAARIRTTHSMLITSIIYIKKLGNKLMEYYVDISTQLRKELEALPRDYTQMNATRNRDVVYNMVRNFNIGRFLIFMNNYYNGIQDKITIAKFGIDGPATTEILYYDGNLLTYVIDGTRFQTNQFHYYFGDKIIVNMRDLNSENEVMIDYNLITSEGREAQIIGIWAGFQK